MFPVWGLFTLDDCVCVTSKFNIVSIATQTLMQRMCLNQSLCLHLLNAESDIDANADVKCKQSIRSHQKREAKKNKWETSKKNFRFHVRFRSVWMDPYVSKKIPPQSSTTWNIFCQVLSRDCSLEIRRFFTLYSHESFNVEFGECVLGILQ